MPPEDINFQTFFAAKIKDRGISIKKLSEATGIAPSHLENLIHGRFEDLPSAPYFRGYIVRLGKVLDFDGDVWWEKIKKEGQTQNSGPDDSLPSNRFIRRSPAKFIWAGVVGFIVLVYLALQLPVIFSKPAVTINFPTENPFTTTSSTLTIQGVARNADSISLNGDPITIAGDGSWQKTVLLQNGLNTFEIVAKKLLGRETDIMEQITYEAPMPIIQAPSSSTSTAPQVHFYNPSEVPATGTFYQ